MSLFDKLDKNRIPVHIAIIMDGNGRWAKARGLDRGEGHKEGVKAIKKIVEASAKASVQYLTLYAFSTENWNRPSEEVSGLMDLMVYAISRETDELKKNGVKILCIGDMNRLPEYARTALEGCIRDTEGGTRITMVIALSYSSKWELTNAARKIAGDVAKGVLQEKDIDEETIGSYLSTRDFPDPDLLVRTGGEQRISNFLLWQCAYAEFYFTETFWPDFGEEELYEAILDYQGRERRYGKISEQIEI
ncbi:MULTISPECIES: isoprenyl transferase [Proteiniphilum]|jgi:undecaprenyl diphosphate synthase|uniref:isoprenyl transferase n=1 Tax=Proteiniphilum TaxID=294702 RepID=UPI001EEA137A|nr:MULTISPECIES: isoprenyl transferase [Proteiniphilum]ULB35292.1 isoprenyl transferase [Proteiniphilum propionicum]